MENLIKDLQSKTKRQRSELLRWEERLDLLIECVEILTEIATKLVENQRRYEREKIDLKGMEEFRKRLGIMEKEMSLIPLGGKQEINLISEQIGRLKARSNKLQKTIDEQVGIIRDEISKFTKSSRAIPKLKAMINSNKQAIDQLKTLISTKKSPEIEARITELGKINKELSDRLTTLISEIKSVKPEAVGVKLSGATLEDLLGQNIELLNTVRAMQKEIGAIKTERESIKGLKRAIVSHKTKEEYLK